MPRDPNNVKPKKTAQFLPEISKEKTFLTEPYDGSKYNFSKTMMKSKVSMTKFKLKSDSKILDSLQSSIQKKNYSSILVLPKLKDSIIEQNRKALEALEFQVKNFQTEYNNILSKK